MPHHVTQRASQGRFILASEHAKAVLMSLLTQWSHRTGVAVSGFALMDNHFHLCATPPAEDSLSRMLGRTAASFSRWLNTPQGEIGPNWQGSFFAAPMDAKHALEALRYVERNPVAAGLVLRPWDWDWSSARFHAGLGPRPKILTADLRADGTPPQDWRRALEEPLRESMLQAIRKATDMGAPLASEEWIAAVESRLGRALRPQPRGRPRARAGERA